MTQSTNWQMAICEHHREGTEPLLGFDASLPEDWRVAECPICGYWAQLNVETGEVRPE